MQLNLKENLLEKNGNKEIDDTLDEIKEWLIMIV